MAGPDVGAVLKQHAQPLLNDFVLRWAKSKHLIVPLSGLKQDHGKQNRHAKQIPQR
jgi:hypothetical protein